MLAWVIFRLRLCSSVSEIVVATSSMPDDDPIQYCCKALGVRCFRGSLENVAQRLCDFFIDRQDAAFVRICADSPMIDPYLVDKAVESFQSGRFDLVSNIQKRTFPKGQSVEVLCVNTFKKIVELLHDPLDKEHVTSYYYKNADDFAILNFENSENFGQIQLSVDTKEDLLIMKQLISRIDPAIATWQNLVSELRDLKPLESPTVKIDREHHNREPKC